MNVHYDTVKYKNYVYYITYNMAQEDLKVSRDKNDSNFNENVCRKATIEELNKECEWCKSHGLITISGIIDEFFKEESW